MRFLETKWREPDEGIWEVRGGRRQFTYSKVMCWVAFDRGIRMAMEHGRPAPLDRWTAERDKVYQQVMDQGFHASRQAFVQHYNTDVLAGDPTPEISRRTEVWLDFRVDASGRARSYARVPFVPQSVAAPAGTLNRARRSGSLATVRADVRRLEQAAQADARIDAAVDRTARVFNVLSVHAEPSASKIPARKPLRQSSCGWEGQPTSRVMAATSTAWKSSLWSLARGA